MKHLPAHLHRLTLGKVLAELHGHQPTTALCSGADAEGEPGRRMAPLAGIRPANGMTGAGMISFANRDGSMAKPPR
ncbi:hypothetical protein [Actibacterium sp. D379-3]